MLPQISDKRAKSAGACSAQECGCCSAEAAFLLENLPLRSLSMKRFVGGLRI